MLSSSVGKGRSRSDVVTKETKTCLVRIGGTVNVHYHYRTRVSDVVRMNIPAKHIETRFGHCVGFQPDTTKEVNIGWLMFKNPSIRITEVDATAANFGLRPMVLPEGLALCWPEHRESLASVLEWFSREAKQSGMVFSQSGISRRQYRLPVLSSSVFLGGKFRFSMVPCMDFSAGELSRISLMPVGSDFFVGEQVFPCVMKEAKGTEQAVTNL